jgi:arylsulfatase
VNRAALDSQRSYSQPPPSVSWTVITPKRALQKRRNGLTLSARRDGDLTAVRYDDWKITFKTVKGNLFTGTEESTNVPWVTNLRQDPWKRYQDQSIMYARWWGYKLWALVPSAAIVGRFLQTFKEYPPSQASGTFDIEKALQMIEVGSRGGGK